MMKTWHLRRTAVAASLMADGLEIQGIQKHIKSRYSGKFTPLAKTLQEDPSCQLCTMMQKLVFQETVAKIESALKQQDLPALITLRQVCYNVFFYLYHFESTFFCVGCYCVKPSVEKYAV